MATTSLFSNVVPPHRHESQGQRITPASALSNIQSYLEASQTEAHLHPDATFTEHGPTFASNATTGGLVLQQLRRVEAGLQGKRLGFAEVDRLLDGLNASTPAEGGEELPEGDDSKVDAMMANHAKKQAQPPEDGIDEQGNYQEQLREQGETDTMGEIGDRNNAVDKVNQVPKVISTVAGKKRPRDEEAVIDKEQRKKAKKERNKEDKAQREKNRQQNKANEDTAAPTQLPSIPDWSQQTDMVPHKKTKNDAKDIKNATEKQVSDTIPVEDEGPPSTSSAAPRQNTKKKSKKDKHITDEQPEPVTENNRNENVPGTPSVQADESNSIPAPAVVPKQSSKKKIKKTKDDADTATEAENGGDNVPTATSGGIAGVSTNDSATKPTAKQKEKRNEAEATATATATKKPLESDKIVDSQRPSSKVTAENSEPKDVQMTQPSSKNETKEERKARKAAEKAAKQARKESSQTGAVVDTSTPVNRDVEAASVQPEEDKAEINTTNTVAETKKTESKERPRKEAKKETEAQSDTSKTPKTPSAPTPAPVVAETAVANSDRPTKDASHLSASTKAGGHETMKSKKHKEKSKTETKSKPDDTPKSASSPRKDPSASTQVDGTTKPQAQNQDAQVTDAKDSTETKEQRRARRKTEKAAKMVAAEDPSKSSSQATALAPVGGGDSANTPTAKLPVSNHKTSTSEAEAVGSLKESKEARKARKSKEKVEKEASAALETIAEENHKPTSKTPPAPATSTSEDVINYAVPAASMTGPDMEQQPSVADSQVPVPAPPPTSSTVDASTGSKKRKKTETEEERQARKQAKKEAKSQSLVAGLAHTAAATPAPDASAPVPKTTSQENKPESGNTEPPGTALKNPKKETKEERKARKEADKEAKAKASQAQNATTANATTTSTGDGADTATESKQEPQSKSKTKQRSNVPKEKADARMGATAADKEKGEKANEGDIDDQAVQKHADALKALRAKRKHTDKS